LPASAPHPFHDGEDVTLVIGGFVAHRFDTCPASCADAGAATPRIRTWTQTTSVCLLLIPAAVWRFVGLSSPVQYSERLFEVSGPGIDLGKLEAKKSSLVF
jgi:hypothetical protein